MSDPSPSTTPTEFDPATEGWAPVRARAMLSNPIILNVAELGYDINKNFLFAGDDSSARALCRAVTPRPAYAMIASNTSVVDGDFTTVTIVNQAGQTVAADIPRAAFDNADVLIVSGDNVGVWTITPWDGDGDPVPCLPTAPILAGSVVTVGNGTILVGANNTGNITAPASEFRSTVYAVDLAYFPVDSGVWDGNPATVQAALDRIAAVVGADTPIP